MANTRCEQDLVGFNPQNTGAVLTIGVATVIGDAVVIDTRTTVPYSGTVYLNIANELGMTAVFTESGTTSLTKAVSANQLLYIPIEVVATDCGYDRCGYWQFTIYYDSFPYYGANTGGEDPDPCFKPGRKAKVCRFDAKIQPKCLADFREKLVRITGSGTYQGVFNLGYTPQCTGPVTVILTTQCPGVTFKEIEASGFSYSVTDAGKKLTVTGAYSADQNYFNFELDYDGDEINCYCDISATILYESCDNPNLFTQFNGGTMSGYNTQAAFNTAGVLARTSTVFQTTLNPVSGTALRTIISNPVDYTNRPVPASPINPSASDGSIVWQGDITNPVSVSSGVRYWLKAKARMPENAGIAPLIKANEEVHLDRFFVSGAGSFNPTIPYFTQHTPKNLWHDIGIRWQSSGVSPAITPFVRYINTFVSGSFTTLIGDLYLNDDGVSDWANVELRKYYPSDCIECPDKSMRIIRTDCEYNTHLVVSDNTPCESVDLSDLSDFGYEPGHDRSDFTVFRRLTATDANGNQTIVSSVNPRNEYVVPAAFDTNPPVFYFAYPVADMGYYEFTLCNVPTFDPMISYNIGSNVAFTDMSGNIIFFECISDRPGFTPGLTTGWQFVWRQIPESDLNDKYCDTQYYVQLCGLQECISEYKNKLICSLDYICSANLCDNECLMNFFELEMISAVTQYTLPESQSQCWTGPEYRDILNYAKKLCSTCNCQ